MERLLSPRTLASQGQQVEFAADKLVLVVDLDETLVYALRKDRVPPRPLSPSEETPGLPQLESVTIVLGDEQFDVLLRPGAVSFLSRMAKYYTIFLYTMGTLEYVAQILPSLDPDGDIFRPGQVCVWTPDQDRSTKDLARVGANPRQVLILDDALHAWCARMGPPPTPAVACAAPSRRRPPPPARRDHVSNLVLISRFVGDRRDSALHVLCQYFRQIHTTYFHAATQPRERDTRTILASICKPLMAAYELTFTGYKHPAAEAMREEPICQLAARFGATLTFVLRPTTTHLVIRDSSTYGRTVDWSQSPKVRQALRESALRVGAGDEPVHVVSEQWLLACVCSLWPVPEAPYVLAGAGSQRAPDADSGTELPDLPTPVEAPATTV